MTNYNVYDCDMRAAHWAKPNGRSQGYFSPSRGTKRVHGSTTAYHPNARWRSGNAKIQAARLFVGFSVGQEPKYSLDDLVKVVRRIRERQTGDPSSSFITQRGIYRSYQSGSVVDEDGAQVVIIKHDGDTKNNVYQAD